MAPVEAPLQLTLVLEEVAVIAADCVIEVAKFPVHPLPSVITTENAPAARPDKSSDVAVLDHKYV